MTDDLRRLNQTKQARRRKVDEPAPDPKEQRNKAFRIQAFLALRFGFERRRIREKQEAAKRETQEKLKAAMERLAASGQDPNTSVITPPTIARIEAAIAEAANEQPAA